VVTTLGVDVLIHDNRVLTYPQVRPSASRLASITSNSPKTSKSPGTVSPPAMRDGLSRPRR
jgi:hypothetical protein